MTHRVLMLANVSLTLASAMPLAAQDTIVGRPRFALDQARSVSFRSAYDMLAVTGDSSQVIGRRTLDVTAAAYADQPAWLLVETRTGAVPAAESLYVSHDMQPLRWSAALGPATLAMVFARDSVFGATRGPGGRQSVLAPVAPKLIVSTAMLEALLPQLPLAAHWSDSVSVLAVNQSSTIALPAELAVVGEDETAAAWIVALRAPAQTLVLWVHRETGRVLRAQQPLPLHTASLLEYRSIAPTPP